MEFIFIIIFFISVGYSTCHWCHVMERESFENETIGKVMNKHFVCIKVDREERPDVDKVYMSFIQASAGGEKFSRLCDLWERNAMAL